MLADWTASPMIGAIEGSGTFNAPLATAKHGYGPEAEMSEVDYMSICGEHEFSLFPGVDQHPVKDTVNVDEDHTFAAGQDTEQAQTAIWSDLRTSVLPLRGRFGLLKGKDRRGRGIKSQLFGDPTEAEDTPANK
jgi:hypothetical protein